MNSFNKLHNEYLPFIKSSIILWEHLNSNAEGNLSAQIKLPHWTSHAKRWALLMITNSDWQSAHSYGNAFVDHLVLLLAVSIITTKTVLVNATDSTEA